MPLSISQIVNIFIALAALLLIVLAVHFVHKRLTAQREKQAAQAQALAERAAEQLAAKKKAEAEKSMEETLSAIQAKVQEERLQQAREEQAWAEQSRRQEAQAQRSIDQWIAEEQAEQARLESRLTKDEQLDRQRAAAKRAELEKAIADWAMTLDAEEMQAKERELEYERSEAKRAAAEYAMNEWAALEMILTKDLIVREGAAERTTASRAIDGWASAEQARAVWASEEHTEEEKATIGRELTETARLEQLAAEQAIAEWVAMEQATKVQIPKETTARSQPTENTPPAKPVKEKTYKKSTAVKEQVFLTAMQTEREAEELNYITNKIQTTVDFMPIKVQDTIEKWKRIEEHRHNSFDDLKLKFRYQAYTIDDGWEVFYRYVNWIEKQRHKLAVFLRLLGTELKPSEPILTAIERAERTEWAKQLSMDIDVLFTLKKIKEIYRITVAMENRLKDLEVAAKKRSDQIVSPSWEPRGTL